ncbi:hypothetical protein [Nocardia rhamnosiphila]|uniref:Uncharacterized protein n=1 Tax=Nocardia rhamnosiphila TaxID=426716 RepID=A0ABV2WXQ8_9NOCA
MTDSSERVWDEAVQAGKQNLNTIELARRHCLDMQFVQSGGQGAVEAATGLPVNMRQVRCPVALGSMSGNLWWVASDFYREHCVGCDRRRPTGDFPNLATAVAEADAAQAESEAAHEAELARQRSEQRQRADRRRSLAAVSDEAMTGVLRDLDVIDASSPAQEKAQARARLNALADRAPELFIQRAVDLVTEVVLQSANNDELLDTLRRLALHRAEFGADVASSALVLLRAGRADWASPCLAQLVAHVDAGQIDARVCRSLILAAGALRSNRFGRLRRDRANDPSGLEAAARIAPMVVQEALREMLPSPRSSSRLVIPRGTAPAPRDVPTRERAAAAGAIGALAATAPAIPAALTEALVRTLAVPPERESDDEAMSQIERVVAGLLVSGIGGVEVFIESAGGSGNGEFRERLMRVLSIAAHMVAPDPRWREAGDPIPNEARQLQVTDTLITMATAHVGGDWGDDMRFHGATIIEEVAEQRPAALKPHLAALLGAVLELIDSLEAPARSSLQVVQRQPAAMRVMAEVSRRHSISSATSRVVKAVQSMASVDALEATIALVDLIANERDSDRGTDLAWWFIPALGHIGQNYGDESRMLRPILTVLHSYMVSTEVSLQGRAIDAWVEIATRHALPSSLLDLLPVLTEDAHVVVAQAVVRAARRLDWPDAEQNLLLGHALRVLQGIDVGEQREAAIEAIGTVRHLTRGIDEPVRAVYEQLLLGFADRLDGYDLRGVLRVTWLSVTERSPMMARLRLRQAADPRINDRWNSHDDLELRDLLACGAGLAAITAAELTAIAVSLMPDSPLAAAEFVEVAWRSGRPAVAVSVSATMLDATPTLPAFESHQLLVKLIHAAAAYDAAAVAGNGLHDKRNQFEAAIDAFEACAEGVVDDVLLAIAKAVSHVRRNLIPADPGSSQDPAVEARTRAKAIQDAGEALSRASAAFNTDTGVYLSSLAAACRVMGHLWHADAAVLDGEVRAATSHRQAASRRAAAALKRLSGHFSEDDP